MVREKKNECVHPRHLALNERNGTVQQRGALLRYVLLCRAGSGRGMLNNGARLEREKIWPVSLVVFFKLPY